MILKIQQPDGWIYYGEVDHIETQLTRDTCAVGCDFIDHRDLDPMRMRACSSDGPDPFMKINFFTKNMTEATEVWVDTHTYLMNDAGRSIEKLY